MANIQLRVCGEFAELPEAAEAIDDNVSPRLMTWVEPLAALAVLPTPAEVGRAALEEDVGVGLLAASGGVGEIEEVSCDGGTCDPRAIAPSCAPAPAVGAATGAFEADD